MRLTRIKPSPENARLYAPVREDDPDILALAESIRQHGVREALILTADRYILSGHRRFAAARLAGLATVPVRVLGNVKRDGNVAEFVGLLREHNRQRVKSFDEVLREEAASADPKESYRRLLEHRKQKYYEAGWLPSMDWEEICRLTRERNVISEAKWPFLDAILAVLKKYQRFWPRTDRQVHYFLLNDPPLRHASKPHSIYRNEVASYKSLCELLTRARLGGDVPWEAIHDPTRPVLTWRVWDSVGPFLRAEIDGFGKGYYRNLMRSQPSHIEIIAEKDTLRTIIQPVAADYTIPLIVGRGYCSLPPRRALAERFKASGKDNLLVLFLTDHDPDGEQIGFSFVASMLRDFGLRDFGSVPKIKPVKVALTAEQVREYKLPPRMVAKEDSRNYKRFIEKHGETVHELESVEPEILQQLLRDAIDNLIDVDLFNQEVDREQEEAAKLEIVREKMAVALRGIVDSNNNSGGSRR
jgi:hypothetical protein